MPNSKFPGPRYNQVLDSDKQIEVVPLTNMDFGGRKVSTDKIQGRNQQVIKHTPGGSRGEG